MNSAPVIYRPAVRDVALSRFEILDKTYLIGSATPSVVSRRSVLGTHGSGKVEHTFVSDAYDTAALKSAIEKSWDSIGCSIRGSLCLYIWDRFQKELAILPDPLGAGVVYYFDDGKDFAISSDLKTLVRFLEGKKKLLTRSIKYSACLMVTGSGGIFPSSYNEIKALDHFQYVVFDREGPDLRTYSAKENVFSSTLSYSESLEATKQDILDNTSAAINAKHCYKIAHLTGGFDSRLVLAAILNLGHGEDFRFFCLKSPQADRDIAEALSVKLGLTMTEFSGADWNLLPGSIEEQFMGPMVKSEGILPIAPDIGMVTAGSLILAGGYGELYRTFSAQNMEGVIGTDGYLLCKKLWESRGFPSEDNGSIFTREFSSEIADIVQKMVEDGLGLGLRKDGIADYLYMRVRNRYFVGAQSREWSEIGSQFDPLYGLNGVGAASKLDFETRRSNVFGFDLLNLLQKDLINYPYAKVNAFDWKFRSLRGLPEQIPFDDLGCANFDSKVAAKAIRRNAGQLPVPSVAQVEKANALRMPIGRIVQFEYARPRLINMIEELRNSHLDFDCVFNFALLKAKVESPIRTAADIDFLLTLYSSCLWLTGKDKELYT